MTKPHRIKGDYTRRQKCDRCGWFVPPDTPIWFLVNCCPDCGNHKVEEVAGRYVFERTRRFLFWCKDVCVGFESGVAND